MSTNFDTPSKLVRHQLYTFKELRNYIKNRTTQEPTLSQEAAYTEFFKENSTQPRPVSQTSLTTPTKSRLLHRALSLNSTYSSEQSLKGEKKTDVVVLVYVHEAFIYETELSSQGYSRSELVELEMSAEDAANPYVFGELCRKQLGRNFKFLGKLEKKENINPEAQKFSIKLQSFVYEG